MHTNSTHALTKFKSFHNAQLPINKIPQEILEHILSYVPDKVNAIGYQCKNLFWRTAPIRLKTFSVSFPEHSRYKAVDYIAAHGEHIRTLKINSNDASPFDWNPILKEAFIHCKNLNRIDYNFKTRFQAVEFLEQREYFGMFIKLVEDKSFKLGFSITRGQASALDNAPSCSERVDFLELKMGDCHNNTMCGGNKVEYEAVLRVLNRLTNLKSLKLYFSDETPINIARETLESIKSTKIKDIYINSLSVFNRDRILQLCERFPKYNICIKYREYRGGIDEYKEHKRASLKSATVDRTAFSR
jgi:hypothetical protein